MRRHRSVCVAILLLGVLVTVAVVQAREPVRQAVHGEAGERAEEEVRGIWGRAVTSFAFAGRVYYLFPVQDYAGLGPEARGLADEWVSLANRRIREYRESYDDDYLKLGLPARALAAIVVREKGWEVRLDRLQFAFNPAACRYYLVVRRLVPGR